MSTVFETALNGKHIVIVGGSSGMGKATAKMATALGAKITIASRSAAKLHAAADEIDGGVQIAPVDTTDEAGVRSCAGHNRVSARAGFLRTLLQQVHRLRPNLLP